MQSFDNLVEMIQKEFGNQVNSSNIKQFRPLGLKHRSTIIFSKEQGASVLSAFDIAGSPVRNPNVKKSRTGRNLTEFEEINDSLAASEQI